MTATVWDLMEDMAEWSRDRSVDPCARWACVSDRLRSRVGMFRTVCGLYAALDRWSDGGPIALERLVSAGPITPRYPGVWEIVATGEDILDALSHRRANHDYRLRPMQAGDN